MSVYLTGMEMPDNCDNCWALDDYGDYPRCRITGEQCGYNFPILEKRMDRCPLIPVLPHGRLIDADALYEKFLRLESEAMSALQTTSIGSVDGIKWSAILTERTGYKFDIVDAPTIIEAEEGK